MVSQRLCVRFVAALLLAILPLMPCVAEKTGRKMVRIPAYGLQSLMSLDASGRPVSGYAYEYIQAIATYAGWKVKYIPITSFAEGLDLLRRNEADLYYDVSKTPDREREMLFPDEAMGREYYYLFAAATNHAITTGNLSALNGKSVGVCPGTVQLQHLKEWCRKKNLSLKFVELDDQGKEEALYAGRIDLDLELSVLSAPRLSAVAKVAASDYYLVASTNRADLLDDINEAQTKILRNDPYAFNRLEDRHFADSVVSHVFTPEEKAWLAEYKTLRVGYFENYLPLSSTDKKGQPTGAMVDLFPSLLRALELEGKLDVVYIPYKDQKAGYSDVARGKIDVMFPALVNDAAQRNYGIIGGRPVVKFPPDLVFAEEFSDEKTKRLAVVRRNLIQDYFTREVYPDAEIVYYDDIKGCIEGVADGTCGATLLNGFRTDYLLRTTGHHDLNAVKIPSEFKCRMAFDEDNLALMLLMDRGVGLLGQDACRRMLYANVGRLFPFSPVEFVRDHPTTVLAPMVLVFLLLLYLLRRVWRGNIKLSAANQKEKDLRTKLEKDQFLLEVALEETTQAEKDRALVFESIPNPVYIFSPEGKILAVNAAAEEMVGKPRAELVGRHCSEILCVGGPKPDWCPFTTHEDLVDQAVTRPDGRSYLISVKHVYDDAGKLSYLLETDVEVTRRHEEIANAHTIERNLAALLSEETLKHPERLLADVRERLGAEVCYLVFGVEAGLPGAVEPGFAALRDGRTNDRSWPFAADPSLELVKPFTTSEPVRYSDHDLSVLKDLYRNGAGQDVFESLQTLYGRRIMLNGKAHGILAVGFNTSRTLEDVQVDFLRRFALLLETAIDRANRNETIQRQMVDAKQMNARLVAERDRAQEAEQARSLFFSSVSHDIRTPLNAIIGFSDLLKTGIDAAAQRRKALESILASGHLLLEIVDDVLDISKLDAKRLRIKPDMTDVAQVTTEVLHSFDVEAADRALQLKAEIAPLPPLFIAPRRLRQILLNLVSNAVKFTEKGSVTVKVTFTPGGPRSVAAADATERVPPTGMLVFSVADTGCGISEENLKLITQPFYQVSQYGSIHGAGLGLTLCTQLVTLMGGRLDIASKLGIGSTFTVTLPKVPYTEIQVQGSKLQVQGSKLDETLNLEPETLNTKRRLRVLIADDAPMNLLVIQSMLKKLHVTEVVSAKDGADALEKLRTDAQGFDMVLTDLWMPVLDGNALAREIRHEAMWRGLPLYAVTADVEAQKTYKTTGFTGLLLKPVTLAKLESILA